MVDITITGEGGETSPEPDTAEVITETVEDAVKEVLQEAEAIAAQTVVMENVAERERLNFEGKMDKWAEVLSLILSEQSSLSARMNEMTGLLSDLSRSISTLLAEPPNLQNADADVLEKTTLEVVEVEAKPETAKRKRRAL